MIYDYCEIVDINFDGSYQQDTIAIQSTDTNNL